MTDQHAAFDGSIPSHYDRFLGPFLFESYAGDLARRLPARTGRVLEVACGTGIVTRQLRQHLPAAELIATDLNEAMFTYAQARVTASAGVVWRQADAAALPFPDRDFDAVVCQFGLMFVPDKVAALREARRVLRPSGTLLFNVWDALAHNPVCRIAHETITSLFPDDPPTFYLTPFGMSDRAALHRLPAEAGFGDVRLDVVSFEGQSPSARDLAIGLVLGNPVVAAIRERGGSPDAVVDVIAGNLVREHGDLPLRAPTQALMVTALP